MSLQRLKFKKPSQIISWNFKFEFGKHKGLTVEEVYHADPGYLYWAEKNIEWFFLKKEIRDLVIDALSYDYHHDSFHPLDSDMDWFDG